MNTMRESEMSLFDLVSNGIMQSALTDSARARCRAADRRAEKREKKSRARRDAKMSRQSQYDDYELQP